MSGERRMGSFVMVPKPAADFSPKLGPGAVSEGEGESDVDAEATGTAEAPKPAAAAAAESTYDRDAYSAFKP